MAANHAVNSAMNNMSHLQTTSAWNYSILAIPAYYVLATLPHSYAVYLAAQGRLSDYDNRHPRADKHKQNVQAKLGEEGYARYERAEAAHANLLENLPLFASAVIVGNLAGFKREGWSGLHGFAASYIALRALYAFVYINNRTQPLSFLRTGLWAASVGLCVNVFVKAANALGDVARRGEFSGASAFRFE